MLSLAHAQLNSVAHAHSDRQAEYALIEFDRTIEVGDDNIDVIDAVAFETGRGGGRPAAPQSENCECDHQVTSRKPALLVRPDQGLIIPSITALQRLPAINILVQAFLRIQAQAQPTASLRLSF